jgi:hypothetical protein
LPVRVRWPAYLLFAVLASVTATGVLPAAVPSTSGAAYAAGGLLAAAGVFAGLVWRAAIGDPAAWFHRRSGRAGQSRLAARRTDTAPETRCRRVGWPTRPHTYRSPPWRRASAGSATGLARPGPRPLCPRAPHRPATGRLAKAGGGLPHPDEKGGSIMLFGTAPAPAACDPFGRLGRARPAGWV